MQAPPSPPELPLGPTPLELPLLLPLPVMTGVPPELLPGPPVSLVLLHPKKQAAVAVAAAVRIDSVKSLF
jgi:hypothetical protein